MRLATTVSEPPIPQALYLKCYKSVGGASCSAHSFGDAVSYGGLLFFLLGFEIPADDMCIV